MNFAEQPRLRTKVGFCQAREAMFVFGFGFLIVACLIAFGPTSWEYAYSMGILPPLHLFCSSCWTFILMCVNSKCAYGYYAVFTILTTTLSTSFMVFFLVNRNDYPEFRNSNASLVFITIAFIVVLLLKILCAVVYCRLSYFDGNEAGEEDRRIEDLYEVSNTQKSQKIDNAH